jgi:hypothetical protein
MAKVLSCPACGAPLSLDDDDDGVVECFYCKRHVVVTTGSLTQAPAQKVVASLGAPAPQQLDKQRKSRQSPRAKAETRRLVLAMSTGLLVVLSLAAFYMLRPRETAASGPSQVDEGLKKLNLISSQQQAAALFGVNPNSDGMQGQLTIQSPPGSGLVQRVMLNWMEQDKRYVSAIDVRYPQGARKKEDVLKKLGGFVHNRLRPGPSARVSQGDAVLDIDDNGFKIWHWHSLHSPSADLASCAERLGAAFALARAAALDGPAPTPAELALVNGAKLEQAGDLDTSVPVEQAVDFFQKKHPAGWCRMQAGLLCVVDVDDKLVDSVHYTWPNGLRARVGQAKLDLIREKATDKALRAVAGCLEAVLGKGEEKVVDYVRGTRNWQWTLGDEPKTPPKGKPAAPARDQVLLSGPMLLISTAEGKPLDQAADWHGKIGKMFSALAACQP